MGKRMEELDLLNYEDEKLEHCKSSNYDCDNCDMYCHCKNAGDEWHCAYDCDLIYCMRYL